MKTRSNQKTRRGITTILMTAALTTLLAGSATAAGTLLPPRLDDAPVRLTRLGTDGTLTSLMGSGVPSLPVATGMMQGGGAGCHRLTMSATRAFPNQTRISVLVETLCEDLTVQGKVLLLVDGATIATGSLYGDGRFNLSGIVNRPQSQIRKVEVVVQGQYMFLLGGKQVVRPLELYESWDLSLK